RSPSPATRHSKKKKMLRAGVRGYPTRAHQTRRYVLSRASRAEDHRTGALDTATRIRASRVEPSSGSSSLQRGERMKRARLVVGMLGPIVAVVLVGVSTQLTAGKKAGSGRFDLVETTIPAVQSAIQNDIITADQLGEMYLARL